MADGKACSSACIKTKVTAPPTVPTKRAEEWIGNKAISPPDFKLAFRFGCPLAWTRPTKTHALTACVTRIRMTSSLRRRQSNSLVYTVCVLVHDILFQIPLSRKYIYSHFWLVKTTVWTNTRQKQANQKPLYISMRLSGIWNKILCTNTQTVKTYCLTQTNRLQRRLNDFTRLKNW